LGWDLLAVGGLSTSLSRPLATTEAVDADFSFGMEVAGVVFKRSSFEVVVRSKRDPKQTQQLMQVRFLPLKHLKYGLHYFINL